MSKELPPVEPIAPGELRALVDRLGLETGLAARLVHVNRRTFRRWLAGTRDADPAAVQLLRAAEAVPGLMDWLMEHKAGGLTD